VSEDRAGGWIAFLIAAIAIAACVMALCGCVPIEDVEAEMLPPEQTGQARELATEHANGMPLDAISYDPPAWMPSCYKAYRIYDRTSGQQWWVLVMGNGYVVLPIGGIE
jgi:hypothetical protein